VNDPMLWNKLDEAAAWLTQATDMKWGVKQVLDAALTQNSRQLLEYCGGKNLPLRKHLRMTCLEAVMPFDTQFGYYETDDVMTLVDNPGGFIRKSSSRYERIELTLMDVMQLLLYGQVQVRIARYPNPKYGMNNICVLIEPVNQKHMVTLDMVVISRQELKTLAREFLVKTPQQAGQKNNQVENKLEWTEVKLKAVLEEYNQPGMTQLKLAKKYNVTRARIGQVLKKAKEASKVKMVTNISQQLITAGGVRKIKGNKY